MLTDTLPLSLSADLPGLLLGSLLTACALASRVGFGEGLLFRKELAMSLPDPILNFRVKQPIKDALHLFAGRIGKDLGPLLRQWVIERLAQELALDTYRSVGVIELQRRLAQPSPAFSYPDDSAETEDRPWQTEANIVLHGKTRTGARG